jgi:hypothetical protein
MNAPRQFVSLLAVTTASIVSVPGALAGGPPPTNPAVAVYVEQIPTGTGSVAARGASRGRAKLSRAVAAKLESEGGSDSAALLKIATSESLGAPTAQRPPRSVQKPMTAASSVTLPAASGASDRRLLGLILALVTIPAVMAVARLRVRGIARRASGSGGQVESRPSRS